MNTTSLFFARGGAAAMASISRRGLSSIAAAIPRVAGTASSAENVGIVALDAYFPSRYVSQTKLEEHDGQSAGKYTIGLGQERMAVAGPQEDINSMCLSALSRLMEKHGLQAKDIGFLGVGTETLVDKSKSTKTVLMNELLDGNSDVEGVTTINACYGGTAALFHAIDWVESSSWDGRYAVVLAGDIAVYEEGPARPTGGAGVVAMLVGPDAPLTMERGLRSSHFEDVYDFYKPMMESEYPRVDGKLSNACYIRSIDTCYNRYADKVEAQTGNKFTRSDADHAVFHLPYTKLVQKSFARFAYNDAKRGNAKEESLTPFDSLTPDESYWSRDLEKACVAVTKEEYKEKVFPSTVSGRNLGNLYCGSLYAGLMGLIASHGDAMMNQRILMFSYGSGLASSMFSFKVNKSLEPMRKSADFLNRLNAREEVSAVEFNDILNSREKSFNTSDFSFEKEGACPSIKDGAYHLLAVDDKERRVYARKAAEEAKQVLGSSSVNTESAAPLKKAAQHVSAAPSA